MTGGIGGRRSSDRQVLRARYTLPAFVAAGTPEKLVYHFDGHDSASAEASFRKWCALPVRRSRRAAPTAAAPGERFAAILAPRERRQVLPRSTMRGSTTAVMLDDVAAVRQNTWLVSGCCAQEICRSTHGRGGVAGSRGGRRQLLGGDYDRIGGGSRQARCGARLLGLGRQEEED